MLSFYICHEFNIPVTLIFYGTIFFKDILYNLSVMTKEEIVAPAKLHHKITENVYRE